MRKCLFVALAPLALAAFNLHTTSAQLAGGIPKPGRLKATPATIAAEAAQPSPTGAAQASAGSPTVIKSRLLFRARTLSSYKGSFNVWSWLPQIAFRIQGELPSGAHLYAEVAQPNGTRWVKLTCAQSGGNAFECGGPNDPEENAILDTGVFPFAIKMRNELAGTEATVFAGKAKVEKAHSGEPGPAAAKHFVYFANQDWALPIGHVYITDRDRLGVRFWVRGEAGRLDPHLFRRGQEVGQNYAPSCGADMEVNTSVSVANTVPQGAKWRRVDCTFPGVVVTPTNNSEHFALGKNPGDYEVRVLRNDRLARSLKFTIGPDGKIADNRIAANNGIVAQNFIIVPVAILDDQDGPWDKSAWKADAFYGNPLTGFTWPPQ